MLGQNGSGAKEGRHGGSGRWTGMPDGVTLGDGLEDDSSGGALNL